MEWVKSEIDEGCDEPSYQSFHSIRERYSNQYVKVVEVRGMNQSVPDGETFAARLDAALRRSGMSKTPPPRPPKLIEYHPRAEPEK